MEDLKPRAVDPRHQPRVKCRAIGGLKFQGAYLKFQGTYLEFRGNYLKFQDTYLKFQGTLAIISAERLQSRAPKFHESGHNFSHQAEILAAFLAPRNPGPTHARGAPEGVAALQVGGSRAASARGVARLRLASPCSRGRNGVCERGECAPRGLAVRLCRCPAGHLATLSADSWGGGSSPQPRRHLTLGLS